LGNVGLAGGKLPWADKGGEGAEGKQGEIRRKVKKEFFKEIRKRLKEGKEGTLQRKRGEKKRRAWWCEK